MRLLLISNSTRFGERYLDHCADAIASLFGTAIQRVLFVPYAIHDHDAYAANVRARFELMGFEIDSVHNADGGPARAVENAQAIFIGGGNTFRLIDALWRHELIEPIRRRVRPACRTSGQAPERTSPARRSGPPTTCRSCSRHRSPRSIWCRSTSTRTIWILAGSTHMGETREQRIAEFHEENTPPVVGLREGALAPHRRCDDGARREGGRAAVPARAAAGRISVRIAAGFPAAPVTPAESRTDCNLGPRQKPHATTQTVPAQILSAKRPSARSRRLAVSASHATPPDRSERRPR